MALFYITPGHLMSPERAILPGGRLRPIAMPTTLAVLTRADGRIVLVDTGFSRAEIEDHRELGVGGQLFRVKGRSAADQLRERGLDPAHVVTIVATHLHLDHIGGFVDFPNAEVVAPAAEFASARRLGGRAGYLHIDRILTSGRARPVSLEGEGRHGFPRHLALDDGGQVLLLDARGHSAGSVAVLLHDPHSGQRALMIGDAAYTRREYRSGRQSALSRLTAFRTEWLRATWGRVHGFELANPDIPVVPSHCHETFPGLVHR